jgi:hypothetical protein
MAQVTEVFAVIFRMLTRSEKVLVTITFALGVLAVGIGAYVRWGISDSGTQVLATENRTRAECLDERASPNDPCQTVRALQEQRGRVVSRQHDQARSLIWALAQICAFVLAVQLYVFLRRRPAVQPSP